MKWKPMLENDYTSCSCMDEFFWYINLHMINLEKLGKPAKALSMLLRCVDLSEKHNTRLVHLQAVSLLAKVMNELDQFQEAYRILSAVMPYVCLREIMLILDYRNEEYSSSSVVLSDYGGESSFSAKRGSGHESQSSKRVSRNRATRYDLNCSY